MTRSCVIYTSLTKGYDDLRQPATVSPHYDFICFSNDFEEDRIGVWQIRKIPYSDAHKTKLSRFTKLNPHRVLPEYEHSVWVDANIQVGTALYDRSDELISRGAICAMIKHPARNCVYREAKTLITFSMGESNLIYRQARFLKEHDFPPEAGLYACSIILRRHNDPSIVKFSNAWWTFYTSYSSRDQMAVSYALRQAAVIPEVFMPSAFLSEVTVPHNPKRQARMTQRGIRYLKGRLQLFKLRLLFGELGINWNTCTNAAQSGDH
jgi:hypothetical protein